MSPACADQTIPASVTGKFSRAESLIDQAATTPGKRTRKVRQKARNLLKQAGTKATHAAKGKKAHRLRQKAKNILKQAGTKATRAAKGKKAKLTPACAAALKDAAARVAAGL